MDISLPISFNGVTCQPLANPLSSAKGFSGLTIDSIDYAHIPVAVSTEKIPLNDGATLSDAWLGPRTMVLVGSAWGVSKGEMWDYVEDWMAAFSPRSPTLDETAPLEFFQPTADISTWSTSAIPLYMTCAPTAEPWHPLTELKQSSSGAHRMQVFAQLTAADPYQYIDQSTQTATLNGTPAALTYRGNAPVVNGVEVRIKLTGTGPSVTLTIGDSDIDLDLSTLTPGSEYVLSMSRHYVTLAGTVVSGIIASDALFAPIKPGDSASFSGTATNIDYIKLVYPEAFF
jgi:hypothetical protein